MARKEKFTVGDIVHVYNRGVKKTDIHRQKSDLWSFLYRLFYLNSKRIPENWARYLEDERILPKMSWPEEWPDREELVSVLAFTIMPNHFHLILKETEKDGISKFMHKLSMSYSKYINAKYDETGSLFEGTFKGVSVQENNQLQYLAPYVMVKNPFELYPNGGIEKAVTEFDKAYEWAIDYPFTSLSDYAGKRSSPILSENKDVYDDIFKKPSDFKKSAQGFMNGYKTRLSEDIRLEN